MNKCPLCDDELSWELDEDHNDVCKCYCLFRYKITYYNYLNDFDSIIEIGTRGLFWLKFKARHGSTKLQMVSVSYDPSFKKYISVVIAKNIEIECNFDFEGIISFINKIKYYTSGMYLLE
jgi:hypothetical protein